MIHLLIHRIHIKIIPGDIINRLIVFMCPEIFCHCLKLLNAVLVLGRSAPFPQQPCPQPLLIIALINIRLNADQYQYHKYNNRYLHSKPPFWILE